MLCLVVVTRKRVMGWSWVWGPMPYILEEKNSTFLDSLVNQKNKRPVQHIVSSLLVLTSQCFVSLCYTASCLRYIWGHVEWGKFTNMKIRTNQSFELKKKMCFTRFASFNPQCLLLFLLWCIAMSYIWSVLILENGAHHNYHH